MRDSKDSFPINWCFLLSDFAIKDGIQLHEVEIPLVLHRHGCHCKCPVSDR